MSKITTRFIATSMAFLLFSGIGVAQAAKFKIGDRGPGGGIIFYVEQAPRTRGFTYLEVTPTDISASSVWCDDSPGLLGGATAWQTQPLGSGSNATSAMSTKCGAGAANMAENYVSSTGKSDWYLPAASEAMWIRPALLSVGKGFPDSNIWTSSEFDGHLAWMTDLRTGGQHLDYKRHAWAVRAIRKFR